MLSAAARTMHCKPLSPVFLHRLHAPSSHMGLASSAGFCRQKEAGLTSSSSGSDVFTMQRAVPSLMQVPRGETSPVHSELDLHGEGATHLLALQVVLPELMVGTFGEPL